MTEAGGLRALGEAIRDTRLALGMTREEASRTAGISRITWRRAEDGQGVQDVKIAAIERTLGWAQGTGRRVLAGGSVGEPADDADQYVERSMGERGAGDAVDLTRVSNDALLAEMARRMAEERDAGG